MSGMGPTLLMSSVVPVRLEFVLLIAVAVSTPLNISEPLTAGGSVPKALLKELLAIGPT